MYLPAGQLHMPHLYGVDNAVPLGKQVVRGVLGDREADAPAELRQSGDHLRDRQVVEALPADPARRPGTGSGTGEPAMVNGCVPGTDRYLDRKVPGVAALHQG